MTPTYDELVEVVRIAIASAHSKPGATYTDIAEASIEALRGAMVPVGWIDAKQALPVLYGYSEPEWGLQALYALPTPEDK